MLRKPPRLPRRCRRRRKRVPRGGELLRTRQAPAVRQAADATESGARGRHRRAAVAGGRRLQRRRGSASASASPRVRRRLSRRRARTVSIPTRRTPPAPPATSRWQADGLSAPGDARSATSRRSRPSRRRRSRGAEDVHLTGSVSAFPRGAPAPALGGESVSRADASSASSRPERVSSRLLARLGSARFRSASAPSAGTYSRTGRTTSSGKPSICAAPRRARPRRHGGPPRTGQGHRVHAVRVALLLCGAYVPTAASTSWRRARSRIVRARRRAGERAPPPPPAADRSGNGRRPRRAPSLPSRAVRPLRRRGGGPGGSRSARTNAVSVSGSRSPGASTAGGTRPGTPGSRRPSPPGKHRAANDAASTCIAFSFSAHPAAASAERSTSHSLASAPASFASNAAAARTGPGSERPEALTASTGRARRSVRLSARAPPAATEFRFPSKSAPPRDARYASRVDARTPSPGALRRAVPRLSSPRGDARRGVRASPRGVRRGLNARGRGTR